MYTILSARYANPEETAVLLETGEASSVLISEADTPDTWAQVIGAVDILPFVFPPPSLDDYRRAIQAHLDATAKLRHYDSIQTAVSYRDDPNPVYAAEGSALFAWRSAVWTYVFAELAKVEAGTRPQPSVADILAELPAMVWPA